MFTGFKLGFVFTNYNNSKYTKDAIDSIKVFDNGFVRIVIVDNNSGEADRKELKIIEDQYENVEVIYSDKNMGYFRGLNIGIHYLRMNEEHYDYLVIGNNDLLFSTDFFNSMMEKLHVIDQYPVTSPNIVTLDGFHQNPHVVSGISRIREVIFDVYHSNYLLSLLVLKLSKITHSFTDRKDEEQHDVAQEIYQGYGACYILGPKFFANFKELFAPSFLMYEEYFLSKQLSDKNFKIFYEPSIKVSHVMHASTNTLSSKTKWRFSRDAHKEYRKYVKVFN